MSVPARLLPIYFSDHLAATTVGVQLAERIARENPDNELEALLLASGEIQRRDRPGGLIHEHDRVGA